jgi:hypothetical protein
MQAVYMICAALAGAALGWAQFMLLKRAIGSGRSWLIALKLPLWAAPMAAMACLSVRLLLCMAGGALIPWAAFACVYWRAMRN